MALRDGVCSVERLTDFKNLRYRQVRASEHSRVLVFFEVFSKRSKPDKQLLSVASKGKGLRPRAFAKQSHVNSRSSVVRVKKRHCHQNVNLKFHSHTAHYLKDDCCLGRNLSGHPPPTYALPSAWPCFQYPPTLIWGE